MASAMGLRPYKHKDGRAYTGHGLPCYVPSSNSTTLAVGDPVIFTANSNSAIITNIASGKFGNATGAEVGTYPVVARATAGDGNKIGGVVVGVAYDGTTIGSPNYLASSTAGIVFVETNVTSLLYVIEADAAMEAGDVNLNTNLVSGSVDSVTGLSGFTADADATADASNQLQVLGFHPDLRYGVGSSTPRIVVRINQPQDLPETGTLGVS